MASSRNIDINEARKKFPNTWQTSLSRTMVVDPLYCCFTLLCPPCAAYFQRERILHNDWSHYVCCGGNLPCSGNCGESNCPRFCAALEVCCCFSMAVATTRYMIQDALQVQNTQCDNCIIFAVYCMQCLDCICRFTACMTEMPIFEEIACVIDRIADISYCVVCSCMQTQQMLELDKRDGAIIRPWSKVPPQEQMMSRS